MNEVINTVLEFVQQVLADTADCIILTGSFVDGNYKTGSDIDILCITSRYDYSRIESYHYRDLLLQTIIVPEITIEDILWQEYTKRDPAYITMLKKGIILRDKNQYAAQLQKMADSIFNSGPAPIQNGELRKRIYRLSSLISDLQATADFSVYYLVFMEATALLAGLLLILNNDWGMDSKFMMRILKERQHIIYQQFITCIDRCFEEQDASAFISLATHTLQLAGGPVVERNNYHLHFLNKGRYYYIQITGVTDYYKDSRLIYEILGQWKNVIKRERQLDFLFRGDPIGDTPLESESIFIAIDGLITAEELHLLIQLLETGDLRSRKIFHPVNYEWMFFTADKGILNKSMQVLHYTYTHHTLGVNKPGDEIDHVCSLMNELDQLFYIYKIPFAPFLTYCAEKFRSMAMDNGKIANLRQLLDEEKKVEDRICEFIDSNLTLYKRILIETPNLPEGDHSFKALINQLFIEIFRYHQEKADDILIPCHDIGEHSLLYHIMAQLIRKIFEALMIPTQQFYFLVRMYNSMISSPNR